jgi:hypothetical protein
MPPKDGVRHRAGKGVKEVGRDTGGDEEVNHTQTTAEGTNKVTMHPAPQCNTNVGVRDGMRAQQCGTDDTGEYERVVVMWSHENGPMLRDQELRAALAHTSTIPM